MLQSHFGFLPNFYLNNILKVVFGKFQQKCVVVGVLGSISFPFLRKKLGLTRTGLVGLCVMVTTLTLCLVSIWVEGSPFQPDYFTAVANTTSNSDHGN